LSPISASGRVRGRPGPRRATLRWDSNDANIGESPACPGVTTTASGRPCPSTSWWTLVEIPPRERPSAWSGGSLRGIRVVRTQPPVPRLSCRPGARSTRLMVACWCARVIVESTETVQSTSPAAWPQRPDMHGSGPTSRRWRKGGAASTPSATARTIPADHATPPRSETDRRSPLPPDGGHGKVARADPPTTASAHRSGPTEHPSAPLNATCLNIPDPQLRPLGYTP
jgi:hypothetical protein